MRRATREWVRKAEGDYVIANDLVLGGKRVHDGVCFHCQQCAEKYLKALLEELALAIPRTHNLVTLLAILTPTHPTLRSLRRGLDILTRYAVDTRYPGDTASKRQATSATRWAEKTRTKARRLLGLRT